MHKKKKHQTIAASDFRAKTKEKSQQCIEKTNGLRFQLLASEVSIACKHKEHIDTIAHPRAPRFSSVGILPWASLQKVKE